MEGQSADSHFSLRKELNATFPGGGSNVHPRMQALMQQVEGAAKAQTGEVAATAVRNLPLEQLASNARSQAEQIQSLSAAAAQREALIGQLQVQLTTTRMQLQQLQQQVTTECEQIAWQHDMVINQAAAAPAAPASSNSPCCPSVSLPLPPPHPLRSPRQAQQHMQEQYHQLLQQLEHRLQSSAQAQLEQQAPPPPSDTAQPLDSHFPTDPSPTRHAPLQRAHQAPPLPASAPPPRRAAPPLARRRSWSGGPPPPRTRAAGWRSTRSGARCRARRSPRSASRR